MDGKEDHVDLDVDEMTMVFFTYDMNDFMMMFKRMS